MVQKMRSELGAFFLVLMKQTTSRNHQLYVTSNNQITLSPRVNHRQCHCT